MKTIASALSRWLSWLSTDHLAVGVSAFYGLFIWCFHSFAVSSAFQPVANTFGDTVPPEAIFSVPLVVGAVLHAWGIRRQSHGWMLAGALCSFAVFAAALGSCFHSAANSTGVPAYLGYCLAYAVLSLRHSAQTVWGVRPVERVDGTYPNFAVMEHAYLPYANAPMLNPS